MKAKINGIEKLFPKKYEKIVNEFQWVESESVRLSQTERETLDSFLLNKKISKLLSKSKRIRAAHEAFGKPDFIRINKVNVRNSKPRYEAEFSGGVKISVSASKFSSHATHQYNALV